MKVIFLDIDGVLALSGDLSRRKIIREGLTTPYLWNPEACEALQDLCDETKAEIVLSSDWRKHFRLPEMREIFGFNGLDVPLIGYTPVNPKYTYSREYNSMGIFRSEEINDWLKIHGVKQWVAIDDLNLSGLPKENFVRCLDTDKGITGTDIVERMRRILNGDLITKL